MQIEHVALWTADLERLAAFYQRYFGAQIGQRYHNPTKGFESRFLSFERGCRLELMSSTTLSPARMAPGAQRMGLTHLALKVGTQERVEQLTEQLRADGYSVVDGPRRTGDGYFESVVLDADGNRLEIAA